MLPAYAGMIRAPLQGAPDIAGAPRVCGDDPCLSAMQEVCGNVLPAYAGMIPFQQ